MKKKVLFLSCLVLLAVSGDVKAHHCHSHSYLVHKDYYQEELNFHDCKDHYVLKETNVYYYSNGSRYAYTTATIFNNDGSVIESNCRDVKHIIYGNKHYFTFYKNKKYNIITSDGFLLTDKKYKQMTEIYPNRLLVKLDKKYGVIDLKANKIIPVKYKKFEKIGTDLFLTKLNGYWGMSDSSNNLLIKNEYEKITPIYDCYLLKKYGKYGLADKDGRIILEAKNDKIKKLSEFIVVKNNKEYFVYDSMGKKVSEETYRDIKLERNTLLGKKGSNWVEILD